MKVLTEGRLLKKLNAREYIFFECRNDGLETPCGCYHVFRNLWLIDVKSKMAIAWVATEKNCSGDWKMEEGYDLLLKGYGRLMNFVFRKEAIELIRLIAVGGATNWVHMSPANMFSCGHWGPKP